MASAENCPRSRSNNFNSVNNQSSKKTHEKYHFEMKFEILTLVCLISSVYGVSYTITSKIYIDVKINRKPAGRIVFGLFGEEAPKTVKNFRHICLMGINGTTYIGSKFHRIIDRFIVQGGDIVSGNGLGSASIYGEYFDDENLKIEHLRPGYIGMANRGPNTNGCQFYITSVAARYLDGKHVIFGKVVEGMDTLYAIESVRKNLYLPYFKSFVPIFAKSIPCELHFAEVFQMPCLGGFLM